ncbi:hypothetical protein DDI_0741 [Dickeya dianthicola RNS04.9]|nr:hypothetical protein DDI_0741 [Dickeya dianthicola RNS04.9]
MNKNRQLIFRCEQWEKNHKRIMLLLFFTQITDGLTLSSVMAVLFLITLVISNGQAIHADTHSPPECAGQ